MEKEHPVNPLVRIELAPGAAAPEYKTPGAAGADLRANVDADMTIPPMGRAAVPTGIFLAIPEGFEGQVRPRSGLALNSGITCLNSPGTIDSDYRGEVKVILANIGSEPFTVAKGDRIAQLVIAPVARAVFSDEHEGLSGTERGSGGFGSTGGR